MDLLRAFPVMAVLIGSAVCGACAAQQSNLTRATSARSAESDRAAVRAAVLAHWDAINRGDAEAIRAHHTEDVTAFLADLRPRLVFNSPEGAESLRFLDGARPDWTVRDLSVQLLGDVAVATFYLDGAITFADGRVDPRTRRVSEVWVRDGDQWKEAHHHDDAMGEAPRASGTGSGPAFVNAEYWGCPEENHAALEAAMDSIWGPLFDDLVAEGRFLSWAVLRASSARHYDPDTWESALVPPDWDYVVSWRAVSEEAFDATWREFISRLRSKFTDDPRPTRFCDELRIVQYQERAKR